MSARLSSRVTASRAARSWAWPRRSKVRQMQPSAAISWARAMYCSWLPSHPCTSMTPVIRLLGPTRVPAMLRAPTGMWMLLCRVVVIARRDGVFGERADLVVHTAEIDHRAGRQRLARAEDLVAAGAHDLALRVGLERLQRGDLRAGGAAGAP